MSTEVYSLLAYAARYWFCALMLLIVFRALRATVVDNRRARVLRAWTDVTGCIGEFVVNPGGKRRVSHPVPREGALGSSHKADICLRYKDVQRMHAHVEQREGGLLVTPLGDAKIALDGGLTGEALFLRDGDVLRIGSLRLMLVLFEAPSAIEAEEDELFFPDEAPQKRLAAPKREPYDEFFDEEALWRDKDE